MRCCRALCATCTFVPVVVLIGFPLGAEAMYMYNIYAVFTYDLCVFNGSVNVQAFSCGQGCIFCAQNDAAVTGQFAVDGHIAQNGEGLAGGNGNACSLVNDYSLAGQGTPVFAQRCVAGFDGHAPVGVHCKDHIGGDVLCAGVFGACHSVNGGVVVSVGLQSTAVHHDFACYGADEGLAVQIQSNACGQNNGSKVFCAGMVSQQNDFVAVLSCFDCFIQRCVLLFADLSNCNEGGVFVDFSIGVACVILTGVSGVAVLAKVGSGINTNIIVLQSSTFCCDGVGGAAAIVTLCSLGAVDFTLCVVVVNVVGVGVLQSGDGFDVFIAASAGLLLRTCFGASSSLGNYPITVAMTQCVNFVTGVAVATCGASVGGVACFCAGRCSHYGFVAVTGCCDLFGVAIAASTAEGLFTLFCTGGFLGYRFAVAVTQCGYYFLCYQNFATYGAVLAFSQTGFSASCCYCCVNYFGMTQSIDYSLCYQNCITYGAVLAFGLTCGSAGCFNCCVNYFGVAQCLNGFLSYQYFAAYITVLAFGQTGFGTSCCYCCVNYFGVAGCFAFGCTTCGTGLGSGAGCSSPRVTQGFAFGCATYGTGLGGIAVSVYPRVAQSVNGVIAYHVTASASNLGVAVFRTGCSHSGSGGINVVVGIDFNGFYLCFIAKHANIGLAALCLTGCRNNGNIVLVCCTVG